MPGRRRALAGLASLGSLACLSARAAVPPRLPGDWLILVDGDLHDRILTFGEAEAASDAWRFEAKFAIDGGRGKPVSGTVTAEAGGPGLRVDLPSGARLILRQVSADRWSGEQVSKGGKARIAQMVRLPPDEPASLALVDRIPLRSDSRIRLVYFGADDCVFCRRWEGRFGYEGEFLQSPAAEHVELVRIKRAMTVFPDGIDALPPDLRALVPGEPRLASYLRSAPGWLVLVDDRIVLSRTGLSSWAKSVEPFVTALARRRAGRS